MNRGCLICKGVESLWLALPRWICMNSCSLKIRWSLFRWQVSLLHFSLHELGHFATCACSWFFHYCDRGVTQGRSRPLVEAVQPHYSSGWRCVHEAKRHQTMLNGLLLPFPPVGWGTVYCLLSCYACKKWMFNWQLLPLKSQLSVVQKVN